MFTYNLQPFVSVLPGAIVSVAYLPTSDDFDLLIKAARVTPVEHREEMEPGALEYVIDVMRTTREPAWNVIVDEFDVIMARPGSGMAFVELLTHAEHCRLEDGDPSGVVRAKIDQMIAFLVSKAGDGMEAYDRSDEGSQRPADIYRAFGPALKYATSTLGSFAARAILRRLSLETTMPFSELENPDWIDPYTGQGEKSYSQVRVRKLEDVSCAGNIPTTLADMLENMEQNDRAEFELMLTRCGWTLDDYWLQFQEAQRGGFNPIADEGEEHVEVEFDVIEKDFEYKEDYTTTTALEGLRSMYAKELKGMRDVLRELGHGLVILRRQPERVAWAEKWLRPQVRHSEPFRRMFKFVKSIAHLYEPQDLLALLLPFQNEIGYSLADLAEIKIPGQYHNLDEWYRTFEEQFLSQFTDQAGRMEPEPIGDELDGYVEELIGERVRVYLSPEAELRYEQTLAAAKGKRSEREAKAWTAFWGVQAKSLIGHTFVPTNRKLRKNWGVHHAAVAMWKKTFAATNDHTKAWVAFWETVAEERIDARYTPEFVQAEIMASIMGDGAQGSAFKSGWAAWREKIDPAANTAYHQALQGGKKPGEAMQLFWDMVSAHRNAISKVTKDGLVLGSGRQIDWGMAKIKIEKGEIRLTPDELKRLANILASNRFGPYLAAYLHKHIASLTTAVA